MTQCYELYSGSGVACMLTQYSGINIVYKSFVNTSQLDIKETYKSTARYLCECDIQALLFGI